LSPTPPTPEATTPIQQPARHSRQQFGSARPKKPIMPPLPSLESRSSLQLPPLSALFQPQSRTLLRLPLPRRNSPLNSPPALLIPRQSSVLSNEFYLNTDLHHLLTEAYYSGYGYGLRSPYAYAHVPSHQQRLNT
jgi:hypothetical protein